jgi:hypothetical protein
VLNRDRNHETSMLIESWDFEAMSDNVHISCDEIKFDTKVDRWVIRGLTCEVEGQVEEKEMDAELRLEVKDLAPFRGQINLGKNGIRAPLRIHLLRCCLFVCLFVCFLKT